jgi:signal transduction histidine kinase
MTLHDAVAARGTAGDRLIEVANALATTRTLTEVTAILRSAARELTGADGVTVVIREGANCYYADEEAIAPLWKGQRFPTHQCISGWVMRRQQPVVIPDVLTDPRIPHDLYRPTFVRSMAMVPIREKVPIGALGAYWATSHVASDAEVKALTVLASSAALAMANVQLYEELRATLERERDARRRAEAAAKGKDDFLAVVSHELRQPLQAGLAALSVMSQLSSRDKGPQAHAVLQRQLLHMRTLLDDLLEASRIMRNQITVRFDTVDVRVALQQSIECVQPAIDGRCQRLSSRIPRTPLWVRADPQRLVQVFSNLLGNATKFSPDGGAIDVALRKQSGEAVLVVRDEGRGIPAHVQPHVFELFARGDTDQSGFGIGLAVVDRLIRLHGGSVAVSSDGAGHGAEFTVRLPLHVTRTQS